MHLVFKEPSRFVFQQFDSSHVEFSLASFVHFIALEFACDQG